MPIQLTQIEKDNLAKKKERFQLSLFQDVDVPDAESSISELEDVYSNSITKIDLIPRFYRGKGARTRADNPKRISKFQNRFKIRNEEYIATVTPAILDIKTKEGIVEMSCLPGDSEDVIEKVIFLLATQKGIEKKRVGGNTRCCISFSLYEIFNILDQINKTKSYQQILESLKIIRDSRTLISKVDALSGKVREVTHDIWADADFTVSGTGKSRDKCIIAFSDFVSHSIENLDYRQIQFNRGAKYSSSFSRFLDLYLTHLWTNADPSKSKKISMNEVMESYGKADKSVVTKRRDMYLAIDDLSDSKVIEARTNAKRIKDVDGVVDYIFEVRPTKSFTKEMIRANAKNKGLRAKSTKYTETLLNGIQLENNQ